MHGNIGSEWRGRGEIDGDSLNPRAAIDNAFTPAAAAELYEGEMRRWRESDATVADDGRCATRLVMCAREVFRYRVRSRPLAHPQYRRICG